MQQSQIQNNQQTSDQPQYQAARNQVNSQYAPQISQPQTPMLKVHADNAEPKVICVVRIVIVLLIITIFFVRFALPPTYKILSNQIAFKGYNNSAACNPSAFDPQDKIYCLNFSSSNPKVGLMMRQVVNLNQLVVLYMQITKFLNNTANTNINQNLTLQLYSVLPKINEQSNQKQFFISKIIYNSTFFYKISTENYHQYEYISNERGTGFMFRLLFAYTRVDQQQDQENSNYLALLKFSNYSEIAPGINQMTIQGLTINPAFTKFSIVIRGVYCLISIITCVFYLRRYFQLKLEDRILQIKLVAFASVVLVFFNDPLYALTILKPNGASVFQSSLFVVIFLVYIQLFWVFFLRRIYYETEQKKTQLLGIKRSWPFYLLFFSVFVVSIVMFLQYTYFALNDIPIISFADISKLKVVPTIITLVVLEIIVVIYQLVYMGFLLKKYCCQQENQLLWRHKNYLSYYPFFLLIFVIFFAAGASMPYSYEGTWILYGYSFMNIFVFIVQFLYYTPASEMIQHRQSEPHVVDKFTVSSDQIGGNKNVQRGSQIQGNTNLQEEN